MNDIVIRPLRREDFDGWLPLWRGYLTFYKAEVSEEVTRTTFGRFFDAYEPMHALVAEMDGELVGIVHYLFHRNTWMIGPICYLEDLFTSPEARGRGVGRKLIEEVYAAAAQAGSPRIYWMTHETNVQAMALYDQVAERSGFVQYRKAIGA